jgi:hypothetical protein
MVLRDFGHQGFAIDADLDPNHKDSWQFSVYPKSADLFSTISI